MYLPNCAIGEELVALAHGASSLNENLAKPEDERNPDVADIFLNGMKVFKAKARPNADGTKIEACMMECRRCLGSAIIELSEPLIVITPPDGCPEAVAEFTVLGELGGDSPGEQAR
ncbi:MAG TPA: hypothetical protein VLF63_02225 [Patescibacteria group bacterium]|nr:hypothetical protein [Patescibacteria group bacterium]